VSSAPQVFVLTGAGVSAESGLNTFRGASGLWRTFRAEEVANIHAWRRDPGLVWEFYSMRREKHQQVQPNAAHHALASWERELGDRFFLCTQNVDRLHELAGSERVCHIHGQVMETKCDTCARAPFPDESKYENGGAVPRCECGGRLRPNVVWFGEPLPQREVNRTLSELQRCDLFVAVGTSGVVEPVASFVRQLKAQARNIPAIYVGPERPANAAHFERFYEGRASAMVPKMIADLKAAYA
jgi:NAD-dependent deacetylase